MNMNIGSKINYTTM